MLRLKVGDKALEVSDIFVDSRQVRPGSVFIAYKGAKVDSHNFIPQAIEKGAKYIIGERSLRQVRDLLGDFPHSNYIQVKSGRKTWADLEAQKYGYPQKKLKIIGITGTDGKTTTAHFIYYILRKAGKKVGLLSTTGAYFGRKKVDTGAHVTTPPPDVIFRVLKEMVDAGIEYAILETTSHGLAQDRVYGIKYEVSGVTNVTREHLDLHKTFENLLKDKARIFEMSKHVVMIESAPGIKQILKYFPRKRQAGHNQKTTPQLHLIKNPEDVLDYKKLGKEFALKFPGRYNFYNAALAAKIAELLGADYNTIYKGLKSAKPPEGRFQRVKNGLGLSIVIDFAHTPNAVKDLLLAVRNIKKKGQRIIVVFGSAGERDKEKRPEMGRVAAELADVVILTLEDPRSEDPYDIALQMVRGKPDYPFIIQVDRTKAIELGLKLAKEGDWVLILGKGHEDEMNIGGVEYPWSDLKAVKKALKKIAAGK